MSAAATVSSSRTSHPFASPTQGSWDVPPAPSRGPLFNSLTGFRRRLLGVPSTHKRFLEFDDSTVAEVGAARGILTVDDALPVARRDIRPFSTSKTFPLGRFSLLTRGLHAANTL